MRKRTLQAITRITYILLFTAIVWTGMTLAQINLDHWDGAPQPGDVLTVGEVGDLYRSLKPFADHFQFDGTNFGIGVAPVAGNRLTVSGNIGAAQICNEAGTNCRSLSEDWTSLTYMNLGGCVGDDEPLLYRQIAVRCLGGSITFTYTSGGDAETDHTRTCTGTECTAGTDGDWIPSLPTPATCTYRVPGRVGNSCRYTDTTCTARIYYLCKVS